MSIASFIPLGRVGDWEVNQGDSIQRQLVKHEGGQTVWMVDTEAERSTHQVAIEEAHRRGGHVLTTGLGLGMFPDLVLESANVLTVTIIENSPEVIALTWPTLHAKHGKRVRLIIANALEWIPSQHYSVIWHDFWPEPHSKESKEFRAIIEPRYGAWCDWQGFWE